MPTRTHEAVVVFRRPFQIKGEDAPFPAGAWLVETEEEMLEALSFPAWRRTATTIRPYRPVPGRTLRLVPIDPAELAAAQAADAAAP
jgi:hypothetical protein